MARNREKEEDRTFADLETKKAELQEVERKRFFDKIQRYQQLNDLKHQQLENYMKDDIYSLARKDEQAYLKAIEEKEQKEL